MLALLHLCIGVLDRSNSKHLLVAVMALGAGGVAWGELAIMFVDNVESCWWLLDSMHLSLTALLLPMPWFVYLHFQSGRRWLAWLSSLMWLLAVGLNFFQPHSLTYTEITELTQRTTFWGESFTYIIGVRNPWALVADLAVLLILAFVVDATIQLWRKGAGWRTRFVCASMIFFFVAAMAHVPLVDLGMLPIPTLIGPIFLPFVAVMSLGLALDVVATYRLSRQVIANEERWSTLLDNIGLLVVGVDRNGRINYVNPHLCEVIGYSSEEMLDSSFEPYISPKDLSEVQARFTGSIQGDLHEQTQSRVRTKEGQDKVVRWSNVLLHDEDGGVSGTISIGADLTEQLRAEQALRETKLTLDHARGLNMLGELSAALAHELSQPLSAILANAQAGRRYMNQDEPEPSEMIAILDDIVKDDKRAAGVIQRLRDLMRPGPIQIECCDMHAIIRDALELCQADLETSEIQVELDLAAENFVADTGRVELQQVILNIVSNAQRAMSGSPVRKLTISTVDENGHWVLHIRDTGSGISEELLPRIFEPFSTSRPEGFGMGLAICRRLLELHGGKITARNLPDAGAEFSVTIPTHPNNSE